MFYASINKIKIFNNREGFLGLFNRAEMRIYGYVTGWFDEGTIDVGALRALPLQSQSQIIGDLAIFTGFLGLPRLCLAPDDAD